LGALEECVLRKANSITYGAAWASTGSIFPNTLVAHRLIRGRGKSEIQSAGQCL
jgi:hypothetical protein